MAVIEVYGSVRCDAVEVGDQYRCFGGNRSPLSIFQNVGKPYPFTTPHGVTFQKTVMLIEVNQAVWR